MFTGAFIQNIPILRSSYILSAVFVGQADPVDVSVPHHILHDPEPAACGTAEGGGYDETILLRVPQSKSKHSQYPCKVKSTINAYKLTLCISRPPS